MEAPTPCCGVGPPAAAESADAACGMSCSRYGAFVSVKTVSSGKALIRIGRMLNPMPRLM